HCLAARLTHRNVLLHCPLLAATLFFVHHPATTELYTLSLHDALPIFPPSPLVHSSVKASVTNYKRQTLTGVLLKMPDGAIAAWSPRRNRNVLSKHPPLRR